MTIRGVNVQRYDAPRSFDYSWVWRQTGQLGQGQPSHQYDWPNPTPVTWYQSWTVSEPGFLHPPFRQMDWPNPTPILWSISWTVRFQPTTTVVLPNNQYNWPIPSPVQWSQSWTARFQLAPVVVAPLPNNQYSWPTPSPISWYQHFAQLIPPPPVPAKIVQVPIVVPQLFRNDNWTVWKKDQMGRFHRGRSWSGITRR